MQLSKRKKIRHNNQPFMTKSLHKAIMVRSKLRNIVDSNRFSNNWSKYKRQRNLCINLLCQNKRHYFNNLNIKSVTDSKKFWSTVKPFFSDKKSQENRITLVELKENYPEKIISNEKEISETFNHYFIDIANNLGLHQNSEILNNTDHLNDLSEKAVEKFKDHPSIIEIKKNRLLQSSFSFQKVSKKTIKNLIDHLDVSKSCQKEDIPNKLIKLNSDIFIDFLYENINKCIISSTFPDELKLAEVIPILKKDDRTCENNY